MHTGVGRGDSIRGSQCFSPFAAGTLLSLLWRSRSPGATRAPLGVLGEVPTPPAGPQLPDILGPRVALVEAHSLGVPEPWLLLFSGC